MAKTPAPAPVQAEVSPEEMHQQAYTRASLAARELRRQIGEQEQLITSTEAELAAFREAVAAQDAEAEARQEENACISAALRDAHSNMTFYQDTPRAASLQAHINDLERSQGALAGILTTWNSETATREASRAEQEQAILVLLAQQRTDLAEMQSQADSLDRTAEEARQEIGRARLASIRADLAEVAALEQQAREQAEAAQRRRASIRQMMAQRLRDYPELHGEAFSLVPPPPLPEVQLLKQFQKLLDAAWEARYRASNYGVAGSAPIYQMLATNEFQWRSILGLGLMAQHNEQGSYAYQELRNKVQHALNLWRNSQEQAQAR